MRRAVFVTTVMLAAVLLSACSPSAASPDAVSPGSTAGPSEGSGSAQPPLTEPATCENILAADVVTELEEAGWKARENPFSIDGVELPGVDCMWVDESEDSGGMMFFAWSTITEEQSQGAQDFLEKSGWRAEGAGTVAYLTEDPDGAMTVDEDGFGMTYAFGPGWVALAETKQDLLLIDRAR